MRLGHDRMRELTAVYFSGRDGFRPAAAAPAERSLLTLRFRTRIPRRLPVSPHLTSHDGPRHSHQLRNFFLLL